MAVTADYLPSGSAERNPCDYTPELSRRARGVEVWAALHSLGRAGIAELVRRNCAQAREFAARLAAAGHEVLNEVVLNQVLVAFGDAERTRERGGSAAAGGHLLVRHHGMARPHRHANQRQQLVHRR